MALRVFCHGQFIEASVLAGMSARFFPEVAETRLELAVPADMVIRIIAIICDRIDMCKPKGFGHFLGRMEDEILRAVGIAASRNLLHHIPGIFHIRSLHGADPERPFSGFVRRNPEHHLVQVVLIETHNNR